MRRTLGLAALVLAVAVCAAGAADEKKKGTAVTLDGMTSTTPGAWVKTRPKGTMRIVEFRLPKVKDDKVDADLAVFSSGGTTKQVVDRWKDQFTPPKGKKIADVAKVREMKVGGLKATYLQIEGTYKAPPFDPKFGDFKSRKLKAWPEFRMLAVQVNGSEKNYQIKLIGPAKTVEHYRKGFEDWLKGFKKD
jgi:hypothetical protein